MLNLLILLLWLWNLGISVQDAVLVGQVWVEAKHYKGWPLFMAWMGGIMSASGFTWCYLFLIVYVCSYFGILDNGSLAALLQLGYLLLIPGVLVSGLMITIQSWSVAYRRRTLADYATAAYNTFVQIHNTYAAIHDIADAFSSVKDFFSGDDEDDNKLLVILLVIMALAAGIMTTVLIVKKVAAGNQPLPEIAGATSAQAETPQRRKPKKRRKSKSRNS